ncbi:RHS repeat-associated core domain-containing protein [Cellulomonas sp. JH27-2]|uniref:RHS repeat-associated core domain-containing protein n=1 Tax=Cellulomonas sp. JH27-2 TaxID=2774139 RepID=UPI00177BE061|nr:RHS repeat-associated core domain-containing protein [Cellulomonas sp. JH27-2]MBD8057526.1 RHS repeat-associated core domain-containing protein [Cellulomonas sp. JH27-2]
MAATITDPDGGAVAGRFYARRAGSSTWNLIDGTDVSVTSGQVARATLPALPAGAVVEWQVKGCDSGTCSALTSLTSSTVNPMVGAGPRKNQTAIPFTVGNRVQAKVDVGTGNLTVSGTGLSVGGVQGDLPISLVYNSLSVGASVPQASTSSPTGYGWTLSVAARLQSASDGSVIYWAGSGVSGTFLPASGGSFTPPPGMTADLATVSGGGWTLTDHSSQQKLTFDSSGKLKKIEDRNGNTNTLSYDPYSTDHLTKISATRGGSGLDVSVTWYSNRVITLTQGSGSSARSVQLGFGAGDLTGIMDALTRTTAFTYTGHQLTKIVAPGGVETRFTYDSRNRVTSVQQVNASAGSPGDSWTRLAYTSDTQTLVSDGAQEQTGSPTSGPHTTYTLTSDQSGRVSKAVDAQNRERSSTFTANVDPATQTLGSGSSSQTTTYTYGANGGESLTNVASQSGAESDLAYGYTDAVGKYLPSSTTNDAGKSTTYTYNGSGNALSSQDALAATASLTFNSDGTVATATAPGNGTNKTSYGYNTTKQLTSITPVTGAGLGSKAMTYDGNGRLATSTNGRGITTTYTYDKNDRATGIDYSGTTPNPDVSFTYDTAGRLATRVDAAGTTTFGYDAMGRLTSRVNTADNVTLTYGYDKASRIASVTDTRGTTTYGYDTAGALTSMVYKFGGSTARTLFAVDDKGRRTDTWMNANVTHTTWIAHSHTDYTSSGRVARVWGERGSSAPVRVVDVTYCYQASSTAPTCGSSTTNDRSFIQWSKDNVTGQVTNYTYDDASRLTGANVSAGTDRDGNAIAAVNYTYGYDSRGNRTTATKAISGGSTTTQTRTFNAANQTTSSGFAYDGAGNQTTDPNAGTVAYTAGDQVSSVTRSGTTYNYTYAGTSNNELISQTTPGSITYGYTYGRQSEVGKPVIEQIRRGSATAYLENDNYGTPVMLRSSAGVECLYIYDAVGSPLGLITSNNTTAFVYNFDPFGVADLVEDGGGNGPPQTPFLFTGGLNDRTTGWTLNGARYYNASEGRWTQQDTLDTPLDPSNANRYAYAANNPVNYVDPQGRGWWTVGTEIVKLIGDFDTLAGMQDLVNADSNGEITDAAGSLFASITVTGLCYTGAALLGFSTGGPGFASALVCEGAGAAAGAAY